MRVKGASKLEKDEVELSQCTEAARKRKSTYHTAYVDDFDDVTKRSVLL